ncbi:MAG TPA: hypothetical protein VNL35_12380 [Chloroflexota bacterium]|nr:hypothetical protein [Chloroflexota bacterium]
MTTLGNGCALVEEIGSSRHGDSAGPEGLPRASTAARNGAALRVSHSLRVSLVSVDWATGPIETRALKMNYPPDGPVAPVCDSRLSLQPGSRVAWSDTLSHDSQARTLLR